VPLVWARWWKFGWIMTVNIMHAWPSGRRIAKKEIWINVELTFVEIRHGFTETNRHTISTWIFGLDDVDEFVFGNLSRRCHLRWCANVDENFLIVCFIADEFRFETKLWFRSNGNSFIGLTCRFVFIGFFRWSYLSENVFSTIDNRNWIVFTCLRKFWSSSSSSSSCIFDHEFLFSAWLMTHRSS